MKQKKAWKMKKKKKTKYKFHEPEKTKVTIRGILYWHLSMPMSKQMKIILWNWMWCIILSIILKFNFIWIY